ncbi:Scr1 family TA system antitoxin-like transcriptional regulator [Streptomyces sp. NPDC006544]|uniref:DUF397 domain-containing protein n=1 Tax=Streptomyces sp. NPDC006544 TaxID=3154583 RepID=UPI0033BD776C
MIVPGMRQTERYAGASAAEARVQRGCDRTAGGRAHGTPADLGANPASDHQLHDVEASLMDRIGGDQIYAEQVRHLRTCADCLESPSRWSPPTPPPSTSDFKNPAGTVLTLAPGAWESFVADGR